MSVGLIGAVLLVVGCRLIFIVGINAQDGEIGRVTGPLPVVCVASEFPYRDGGSGYDTHILEAAEDSQDVLSATK